MAFFGKQTVLADLRLHKVQAGLVGSATLGLFGGSPAAWPNVCKWPETETSGMGQETAASQYTIITAWRTAQATETQPPRADDTWTIAGKIYNIISVQARHTDDESSGYAIYDCTCTRKG